MDREKYLEELRIELSEEVTTTELGRRGFLKLIGGGVTILFSVGDLLALQQRRQGPSYPEDFNAYLQIKEDGRISCFTGKIEMGQGIYTSFAQMVAEELNVSVDVIDMVMGDTGLCPYDGSTTGSRSTKYFGPPLRLAAAKAKEVLLDLASELLKIAKSQLIVKGGIVFDKGNLNKKVSYAQLTKGQKIKRKFEGSVEIKKISEHVISGKSTKKTDAIAKVTGEAKFTGDIRLQGMLYAKILRPPAHGSKLLSVDVSAAKKVNGTIIIQNGDFVAALHEKPDIAEIALDKIKAKWEKPGAKVDNQTKVKHLLDSATSSNEVVGKGKLEDGKNVAVKSFKSVFYNQYVAHAPSETHTATVDVGSDQVRVWASSQAPFRIQSSVAETVGVPTEKVRVFTPFLGCGFGGKKWNTQEVEAARLAKLSGRPVQVAWTRKEEFFYNAFRPAAILKANSGVDRVGKISFWNFDIYFAGTRSSEPVYNIPNLQVLSHGTRRGEPSAHPFRTGAWRGPGSNSNVYAMESQIDIMAAGAGIDPLTFRLNNLTDRRMIKVLKSAADQFGHSFSKGPSGKGYGIALTNYLNTYVVTMAEVKVDKNSGEVTVERVVCAQDLGEIINPQGVNLQLESCITMGLGYCLTEEILFKGGEIFNENYDSYEIPKFSWLPQIETVLVENPELAPQGCGEPAITTMGAVIANAVFDAIGVRMFELPMTPERIKEAIMNN